MTDEDLQEIRDWVKAEQACNQHLHRRYSQLSGSELACAQIERLLEEIDGLQQVIRMIIKEHPAVAAPLQRYLDAMIDHQRLMKAMRDR